MTARDYVTILRRRRLVLLVAALLGVFGGYVTSLGSDDEVQTYEATHTLTVNSDILVPDGGDSAGDAGGDSRTASQLSVLVARGPVPEAAAERLSYDGNPAVLASEVGVEAEDELRTIEISHIDPDPERAADVANAFAEEFVAYLATRGQEAIQSQLDAAQDEIDRIQGAISELDAVLGNPLAPIDPTTVTAERDALVNQYRLAFERYQALASQPPPGNVQTLEPAEAVPVDSGLSLPDNLIARVLLTGSIGLLVGAAIALALEGIDIRIRDREQAERSFGLPVLAEVPALPRSYQGELVVSTDRSVPFVEAYRGLAAVLALHDAHAAVGSPPAQSRPGQVVLVVSPGAGEGKTASVAQIATAFADAGRQVLVLDCDFHRPRLRDVFDIEAEAGVRDALAWNEGSSLDQVAYPTSVPGIRLAPAGRAVGDPARLLSHAHTLIATARQQAEIIVIDTPPLLAVSDAISLAALADAVLVVCRVGRTTRTAAERIRGTLDQVGARALGVVLTATPRRGRDYYGYYEPSPAPAARPKRRRLRRRANAKTSEPLRWDDVQEPGVDGGPEPVTTPDLDRRASAPPRSEP